MKKNGFCLWKLVTLLVAATGNLLAAAQLRPADTLPPYRNMAAGTQYLTLLSQKGLVGQRYRLEWAMPVPVPVALLDTLAGGLRLDGVQQKGPVALQLRSAANEAYSLTPVVQPYLVQVPLLYQNTFIADFAADLQSAYHPYAPLAATALANAAGLVSYPAKLIYLPQQAALGGLKQTLGNQLYYLQRLPVAANKDTTAEWVSTSQLLNLLDSDSRNSVDAAAYVQCRLLDMLLGITNRDEWGWRWLARPAATGTTYIPVPQGYAGAFPLYEGKMVNIAKIVAPVKHLVSFDHKLPNPQKLNERSLHLDRRLTAGLDEAAWNKAAAALTAALTDNVIQSSLGQIPETVRTLSGRQIEAGLKSRRNDLEAYAQNYYHLLSATVDVLASRSAEKIQITGMDSGLAIGMYTVDAAGNPAPDPFFYRSFRAGETKEINLYGIGGQDRFEVMVL